MSEIAVTLTGEEAELVMLALAMFASDCRQSARLFCSPDFADARAGAQREEALADGVWDRIRWARSGLAPDSLSVHSGGS